MDKNIYRRLKVTNNKLFRKVSRLKGLLVLNIIIAVLCISGMIFFAGLYAKQAITTSILENKVDKQSTQIASLSDTVNNQKENIEKLSKVATELDNENSNLANTLSTQQEELDELREREELYDKYDYAIIRSDGSRTDIDYTDIMTLEELAKQEGLGEDAVSLVLAISVNESKGFADVKNPNSSAAGLCGLLSSTAKYSYEVLLDNGKGTYKSSYVYDSLTNLEMTLYYIAYLKENTNSNYELLVAYRGGMDDPHYMAVIQKYTGKSIYALDI